MELYSPNSDPTIFFFLQINKKTAPSFWLTDSPSLISACLKVKRSCRRVNQRWRGARVFLWPNWNVWRIFHPRSITDPQEDWPQTFSRIQIVSYKKRWCRRWCNVIHNCSMLLLVGFGRATLPCTERTRLFRLSNTPKGALCALLPFLLTLYWHPG